MDKRLQLAATGIVNKKGVATLEGLEGIFANIVSVLLGLAGIALFIMLLIGGFRLITSGGDPKQAELAKRTLTYAIGGMVLVALAYLIILFIQNFTGIDVTNFRVKI